MVFDNKEEIFNKFLAALREGNYKKGQGALRSPTSDGGCEFCALGVFADIVAPDGWRIEKSIFDGAENDNYYHKDMELDYGLAVEFFGKDITTEIWSLNDGFQTEQPVSFSGIADYLEKHRNIILQK